MDVTADGRSLINRGDWMQTYTGLGKTFQTLAVAWAILEAM